MTYPIDMTVSPHVSAFFDEATNTGLSQVAVEGVASFYAFLSLTPKSRVTIRR
jgi:NADH:ubiquinone oxidoreductase subunit E